MFLLIDLNPLEDRERADSFKRHTHLLLIFGAVSEKLSQFVWCLPKTCAPCVSFMFDCWIDFIFRVPSSEAACSPIVSVTLFLFPQIL